MVRNLLLKSVSGALALGFAISLAAPAFAQSDPLIIAHRGASGDRPEHTLAAYELAIDQGADYIEPDLVVTKDLELVSRHENELSGTTDVASREEFENRRRDKTIDGQRVAGWFAEDFTLAELRTLRAKERVPSARPGNIRYNGLYQVPTLAEIVQLLRAKEAETGKSIGLYPELKHPTFLLEDAGIDMVDLLLRELRDLDIGPEDPIFIQSFEVGTLQRLNQRSDYKLVQLIHPEGGPVDEPDMRYAEMVTPSGLAEIAAYADGIGPWLGYVLDSATMAPTNLVAEARALGLQVHPWTLRKENGFLPAPLQNSGGPAADGAYRQLWSAAIASGADGFFTDNVKEFIEVAQAKDAAGD
ncbi:glycerophosphodiester phosphodiesterase family protein [Erythrobacter rubeus]|uniref:glycerophosphodiester phosphodiesterase n=1 Tax=Erythrobacter rubeus TaxID=2760803 RepID=A0ABR8KRW7_9SPHN|nr:glycerophosphodiester phosphodiesterase family protein [Erythrobacter rubeus]MBD2843489.1 glycerophosphodiester phosphodiesterase [Erythrobacter rubeus]